MSIPQAEIQTLTPGALITLWKVDCSAPAIGGGIYYLASQLNTLGTPIVWQGQTYTPIPIEGSGFEYSTQGALPHPQLAVSNLDGLINTLVSSLQDMVGAIVTRIRVLYKYIDAVNYPIQTAANFTFSNGNGTTGPYTLKFSDGSVPVNPTIMNMYRTDWQGQQLLYPTSRTNLCLYSQSLTNWSFIGVTIGASTTAPDGTSTAQHISEDSSTGNHLSYQSVTCPQTVYTLTAYMKAAERTSAVLAISDGATGSAGVLVNLSTGACVADPRTVGSWSGISFSATAAPNGFWRVVVIGTRAAGTVCNPQILIYNGADSFTGTTGYGVYAWGAQLEQTSSPTSYIPTTSGVSTVTDYTLAGSAVTMGQTVSVPASLQWSGTGQSNPNADPTAGFLVDQWIIEQKIAQLPQSFTFELVAACDAQGLTLPARQINTSTCMHGYKNDDGLGLCPYSGAISSCDRGLYSANGCAVHFPTAGAMLPFGGFPGTRIQPQ